MQKCIMLSFVLVILSGIALGQVPQLINYQGVLIDPATGQPVPDDSYIIAFYIYNEPSGGSAIWGESHSVDTKNGLYSVLLGSYASLTTTILSGPEKYLGIKVGDDQEMTPRKRIVSVAYAYTSESVSGASNIFPSDGNVGIGTTSPAEKLDVSGTVQMTGFKLTTGINDGYVLTSDADGIGTWQPPSGGLTLPYFGSTSSSSTAFGITNTGTGNAGYFGIDNVNSSGSGLSVFSNGAGSIAHFWGDNPNNESVGVMVEYNGMHDALQVQGYGPGNVGVFDVMSESSGTAVQGGTIGTGSAASFSIGNTANSSPTLTAYTEGLGGAGNFEIRNANNNSAALYTLTQGPGPGLRVDHAGASGYIAQFEDAGDIKVNIDKSGTVEMQGFKMPGSSSNGYVLTSDNNGIGTWQPAPEGLTLPYSGTVSSSSIAFKVINTGTDLAGHFEVDNPDNNAGALSVHYNGYEHPALAVSSYGASSACIFDIANTTNTSDVLWAYTNGLGSACNFYIENTDNSATALNVKTFGTGRAASFSIDNANNSSNALNVYTNGLGHAGRFVISNTLNNDLALYIANNGLGSGLGINTQNTNNNGNGLEVYTVGLGRAGNFEIDNSNNSSTALHVRTNGVGQIAEFVSDNPNSETVGFMVQYQGNHDAFQVGSSGTGNAGVFNVNGDGTAVCGWNFGSGGAGSFNIENTDNNSMAFRAQTKGIGRAGSFSIDNANNSNAALRVSTNGLGPAGHFNIQNNSNNDAALYVTTDGTGPAIRADGMVEMTSFKLSTSPTNGYVLTSDDNGIGTWQPAAGGNDGDWTISGNDMYSTVSGNVGIGTTNPARKLHVNDVLRLQPRASAPSNPSEGDMYMDGTTHKLMVYDGTTWQACW